MNDIHQDKELIRQFLADCPEHIEAVTDNKELDVIGLDTEGMIAFYVWKLKTGRMMKKDCYKVLVKMKLICIEHGADWPGAKL